MSMPESWVNELFTRLSVRYGAAFMRQWSADADPADIKADWARVLHGFEGRHIQHALDHLPDAPPNAMAFRALCLGAPEKPLPRLAGPRPTVDRVQRLREIGEKLKAAIDTQGKGPAYAAQRLREIAATRPLTEAQKQALRELERVEAPDADMGTFNPIPKELWPWNQRA